MKADDMRREIAELKRRNNRLVDAYNTLLDAYEANRATRCAHGDAVAQLQKTIVQLQIENKVLTAQKLGLRRDIGRLYTYLRTRRPIPASSHECGSCVDPLTLYTAPRADCVDTALGASPSEYDHGTP